MVGPKRKCMGNIVLRRAQAVENLPISNAIRPATEVGYALDHCASVNFVAMILMRGRF
jgi:hypothetical protein